MSWTEEDPRREPFGAGALPVSRYTLIPAREIIERPGGVRIALTPRVAAILRANGLDFVEQFGREETRPAAPEPYEAPAPRVEDTTGRTRRERRRR